MLSNFKFPFTRIIAGVFTNKPGLQSVIGGNVFEVVEKECMDRYGVPFLPESRLEATRHVTRSLILNLKPSTFDNLTNLCINYVLYFCCINGWE